MPSSPLVDILVVLLFAKLAAELAERAGLPAVVGEIAAGIVAGPSMLGWVHDGEILQVLGEIGVILLLLNVGLEMDLGELGAVGKAALSVAVVGVALPMIGGAGAGALLGMSGREAVFVGAALTATSVGITARVFGDLRELASVEARTVLGAAVADDVIGLVLLTVVVRVVDAGSISVGEVSKVVVVAVAFLVVSVVVGIRLVPPVFSGVARLSRSTGTLVGLALAFTLGMSRVAEFAKLAPIIGAFVAGICLARSDVRHRVAGDLTSVGHLFVPVFFFRIGVDADIAQFARGKVLAVAAVLLAVAVAGKLASSLAAGRSSGDRVLIGFGMLPRGEVGLIFATIGLQSGIFGTDIYASLLLVVLLTTLLAPPLLRWRLLQQRKARRSPLPAGERPPWGWLVQRDGLVELSAVPPVEEAAVVAFDAAGRMDRLRPGPGLLGWIAALPDDVPTADPASRAAMLRLLDSGGPRAWRFLYVAGLLRRALPELDTVIAARTADPFETDPLGPHRWPRLARLTRAHAHGDHVDPAVLAALALDATEGSTDEDAQRLAQSIGLRLGLDETTRNEAIGLVGDANLLLGMANRTGIREADVRQLADHLGSRARLNALDRLTRAAHPEDPMEDGALDELVMLTTRTLASEHEGPGATGISARLEEAAAKLSGPAAARVLKAPRSYAVRVSPADLVRHAAFCEPAPAGDDVRVSIAEGLDHESWRVEIVAADRVGLLAHEARVLAAAGCDVVGAVLATWPDGVALASFSVRSFSRPEANELARSLQAVLGTPPRTEAVAGVGLTFDQDASPWHTVCRAEAENRFGLLASLASVFAAVGANVHSADVATIGGVAVDVFELTGRSGGKLKPESIEAATQALRTGVLGRRRFLGRKWVLTPAAGAKPSQ